MATRFTPLIQRLWPGDAGKESRAIAEKFAERFGDMPMAADHVEGWLREGARLDGLIVSGAMTHEQAQEALYGFTEIGTAPHVLAELQNWSNEVTAELAATEAPPDSTAEQPPIPAQPIQERPAAPAPQTIPPQAQAFDGQTAKQTIAKYESAMRAAPNSVEWASYWKNPQAQADYRTALDFINGGTSVAPSTLAEDAAEVRAAITGTAPPAAVPPAEPAPPG